MHVTEIQLKDHLHISVFHSKIVPHIGVISLYGGQKSPIFLSFPLLLQDHVRCCP
jgi:hypothetical protein